MWLTAVLRTSTSAPKPFRCTEYSRKARKWGTGSKAITLIDGGAGSAGGEGGGQGEDAWRIESIESKGARAPLCLLNPMPSHPPASHGRSQHGEPAKVGPHIHKQPPLASRLDAALLEDLVKYLGGEKKSVGVRECGSVERLLGWFPTDRVTFPPSPLSTPLSHTHTHTRNPLSLTLEMPGSTTPLMPIHLLTSVSWSGFVKANRKAGCGEGDRNKGRGMDGWLNSKSEQKGGQHKVR
jgi:hypothetical protein